MRSNSEKPSWLFGVSQYARYIGLGNMQISRSSRYRSGLHDGVEDFQLSKIHSDSNSANSSTVTVKQTTKRKKA